MNIRDLRQIEYANMFMDNYRRIGILLLSVRMGKTRVGLRILSNFLKDNILVCYPDNRIKDSWIKEAAEVGHNLQNITFVNFSSLHKHWDIQYDVLVVDECHDLSPLQMDIIKHIQTPCKAVLGLTGTLMAKTKSKLHNKLKWNVIAEYTTEQAIADGIISNYHITIHRVKLDHSIFTKNSKGKLKSERDKMRDLSYVIDEMQEDGKDTKFLRLRRMRILQNSIAKLNYTSSLLQLHEKERILVFCALSEIVDSLGIPTEHSKSKQKGNIELFMEGLIPKLGVVDMAAMGVTFKPLNRVIINYINSNSEDMYQRVARALNLDYVGETAQIDVVCSTEQIEVEWLMKALKLFNKQKITIL